MADSPINANIADLDGGFHPVLMRTVPRVGELIHLWLHSGQVAGHRRAHHYEVVEVVHKVYEIGGEADGSGDCGADHFITVYVRALPERGGEKRACEVLFAGGEKGGCEAAFAVCGAGDQGAVKGDVDRRDKRVGQRGGKGRLFSIYTVGGGGCAEGTAVCLGS